MHFESRRQFLKKTAVAASAFSLLQDWAWAKPASDKLGPILPTRKLLRNGFKTTAFGLGGYHVAMIDSAAEAERLIERSLELGVRFFDNARKYIDGRGEEYFGRFLTPKYREHVFIMTKAPGVTGGEVTAQLDASLAAMKLDYVDLWQIHALRDLKDVDDRATNGVVDAFLKAKADGKAKHLGFTGHVNPRTHLHFIELLEKRGLEKEFETCQMPVNVCDASYESFQKKVLPVLLKKDYGVIAMKTMAGGSMMGARIDTTPKVIADLGIPNVVKETGITFKELHQYVYSLPVSVLCSGCLTVEQLEQNVASLTSFKHLSTDEMKRLVEMVKAFADDTVENYKRVLTPEGSAIPPKPTKRG